MCGIWGYFSKNPSLTILRKFQLLRGFYNVKTRGPDRSEIIDATTPLPFLLGFHRLAIMDVSTNGDQPFRLEYQGRTIYSMCNGEIYNFTSLAELHGIELYSRSDCEILHSLYVKFGFAKTISMLCGEFAISIVDIDNSTGIMKVYLGRDPLGVRSLYIGEDDDGICFSSVLKGFISEKSQLIKAGIRQFPPGHFMEFVVKNTNFTSSMHQYYSYKFNDFVISSLEEAKQKIKESFKESVICRLASDRPIGCLLSGGLDSSLVVSIAARHLKSKGRRLRTFSIGMHGSTDRGYAEMVSKHCDTDHTHIELEEKDFLDKIPHTIWTAETYDTTTVRATVGQLLACEYIANTTDITVLLIGDGADELCGGYLYFHKAPSSLDFHNENRRLLEWIYMYDGQRADRGVSSCGLEARLPFLDHRFVDLYMSINPELRVPMKGIEKWLLRETFADDDYLPKEVLYRRKEAFSDGVSGQNRSWYEIIQEDIENTISDESYYVDLNKIDHCKPVSKESLHFRKIFHGLFGASDVAKVVDHLWLPKKEWVGDIKEASARALTDLYTAL